MHVRMRAPQQRDRQTEEKNKREKEKNKREKEKNKRERRQGTDLVVLVPKDVLADKLPPGKAGGQPAQPSRHKRRHGDDRDGRRKGTGRRASKSWS